MSDSAQSLDGWTLKSITGRQTFAFPAGASLEPGASLSIRSGPTVLEAMDLDPETETEALIWTQRSCWNDNGDTASLFNADGTEVARRSASVKTVVSTAKHTL